MAKETEWFSDTRISMPQPTGARPIVSMGGFVFTENGMAHDISEVDYDRHIAPPRPPSDPSNVVYDDGDDAGAEFL